LDTRIGSRRAPFLVGSLITFVRLNSEIISNNLLLFSRNKSTFKSPFMKIPCLLKRSYMRKVWLYKKADFNKIINEILEFQWEQFLHKSTDIEDMSFNLILTNLEGILLPTISRYLCVNLLDMSSISVLLCRNCSHWNSNISEKKYVLVIHYTN
jgi:hypothetical protein